MVFDLQLEKLLHKLTPLELQSYIRLDGWRRAEEIDGDIAVYYRPEDRDLELVIPKKTEFQDFYNRIYDALHELTLYEQRPMGAIITDILSPAADILRFRLDDTKALNGTVPLDDGLEFISNARKSVLSSACTVLSPQKYFRRLSNKTADDFISSCRLGQTEVGSYIVSLICPMKSKAEEEVNQLQFIEDLQTLTSSNVQTEPFTRMVTKKLIKSVEQIVTAIDQDKIETLIQPDSVESFISANLCEALVEMQTYSEGSNLQIIPTWFKGLPIREELPTVVTIKKEYFPAIEFVAKQLWPEIEDIEHTFTGKVYSLRGQPDAEERMAGEILLQFQWDERLIKAKIDLTPDEYSKACDAHKYDRFVVVKGVLHEQYRNNQITNCSYFEIINS